LAASPGATSEATLHAPVVIINAATSVRCRHYSRFADYLFANGFDVITYDYRGIGESRRGSLRGFKASWSDWGRLDFEAILQRGAARVPGAADRRGRSQLRRLRQRGSGRPAQVIRRLVTVGAQFAYWRDYAASGRWRMVGKWHVVMPLVTALFGYFPGKRLGWLEEYAGRRGTGLEHADAEL
jgi:predicted alpha/beta hydrolase